MLNLPVFVSTCHHNDRVLVELNLLDQQNQKPYRSGSNKYHVGEK